jgi:hypothetical protein
MVTSNMNRPFRGSSSRSGAGATLAAALWPLVVLGCSSSSATPADSEANPDAATQVTGTAGGSTFVAEDAIFTIADLSGFEFHGQSTALLITTFPGACAKEQASAGVKGGRSIIIGLAMNDASGNASAVATHGTHVIASGSGATAAGARVAQLFYQRVGDDCLRTESHQAASGQVAVTSVDTSALAGTFDVVLSDTNEHVTGSFVAASCSSFDPNRTPLATCQ